MRTPTLKPCLFLLVIGLVVASPFSKAWAYCVPTLFNCMCTYLTPCPVVDVLQIEQAANEAIALIQEGEAIGNTLTSLDNMSKTLTGITSTLDGRAAIDQFGIQAASQGLSAAMSNQTIQGMGSWAGVMQGIVHALGQNGLSTYVAQPTSFGMASPMWGTTGIGNLSGGMGGQGMMSVAAGFLGGAGGSGLLSSLMGGSSVAQASIGPAQSPYTTGCGNTNGLLSSGGFSSSISSLIGGGGSTNSLMQSAINFITNSASSVFGAAGPVSPPLSCDSQYIFAPQGGAYSTQMVPNINPTGEGDLRAMSATVYMPHAEEAIGASDDRKDNVTESQRAAALDSYTRALQMRQASVGYLQRLQILEQGNNQDIDVRSAIRYNSQVRMAIYSIQSDIYEITVHLLRLRSGGVINPDLLSHKVKVDATTGQPVLTTTNNDGDSAPTANTGSTAPMPLQSAQSRSTAKGANDPGSAPQRAPDNLSAPYDQIIQSACDKYGVPAGIIRWQIYKESRFNPIAKSPNSTATGISQIVKGNTERPSFGLPPVKNRLDPVESINFQVHYMRKLYELDGSWPAALHHYGTT